MKSQLFLKQRRKQQLHTWINKSTDFECNTLEIVSGDASFRRYFRFVHQEHSIIAVDAPPEHENTSQFIAVAKSFRNKGIKVPDIYAYDLAQGFYLQQDFGNRLFADGLTVDTCDQYYCKALANIPLIQSCVHTEAGPLPVFNGAFIDKELSIFSDWLLNQYLQLRLSDAENTMLAKVFDAVKKACLLQPKAGMHRDYHSRNLMLLTNEQIGVIDFQDAVVGPITYDAVSLLRDSYQKWPKEKVQLWLQNWHADYYTQYPWQTFKMWFDAVGMQRHIKIAGIFARLWIRDNKSSFLSDIPDTLHYLIDEASQYAEYSEFVHFLCERVLPNVIEKLKVTKHDV